MTIPLELRVENGEQSLIYTRQNGVELEFSVQGDELFLINCDPSTGHVGVDALGLDEMVERIIEAHSQDLPMTGQDPKAAYMAFHKAYPGTKDGVERMFELFKRKAGKKWQQVAMQLMPALEAEIADKAERKRMQRLCPDWKNLKTWLNNCCWETQHAAIDKPQATSASRYLVYVADKYPKVYTEGRHLSDQCFADFMAFEGAFRSQTNFLTDAEQKTLLRRAHDTCAERGKVEPELIRIFNLKKDQFE